MQSTFGSLFILYVLNNCAKIQMIAFFLKGVVSVRSKKRLKKSCHLVKGALQVKI